MRIRYSIIVLLIFLVGCECSSDQIDDSIESGNRVVEIAFQFKEKRGYFPESLRELQSFHGEELPKPACGNGVWVYGLFVEDSETHFSLKVQELSETSIRILYVSNREGWLVDTK